MSKLHGARSVKDLGPRATKTHELMDVFYRAEIAEALLKGEVPRSNAAGEAFAKQNDLKEAPSSVASLVLAQMKETNREARRKAAKVIMSEDLPKMRKLSREERKLLQSVVDPDAKKPLVERMNLAPRLKEILFGPKFEIKPDVLAEIDLGNWRPVRDILGDFYPNAVLNDEDGRPDDAEPEDEPTPTPTPPSPVLAPLSPIGSELRFVIEALTCVDTTVGEAGPDEISFDGVSMDMPLTTAATAASTRLQALSRQSAGNFVEGSSRTFTPELAFARFDLTGLTLPHLFDVTYVMAETDPGRGLQTFMTDMEAAIRADLVIIVLGVIQILGGAVVTGLGIAAIVSGALVGSALVIAAGIGVALIGIGSIVFGAFFSGFANSDDIFDVTGFALELDQDALSGDPFNGGTRTPTEIREIEGDGGLYQLVYHWELDPPIGFIPVDQDEA